MKIDPGLKQVNVPSAAERTAPSQSKAKTPAGGAQTEVSLSPLAARLKELETQLAALPVVDRARVDSIKEAIARGQYVINTDNIAEGLLDSVKEMIHVAK
jgi:negative regulator of flagellin synthesis FlgM